MKRSENRAEAASYRHPIYAAADQLKAALILTGFSILDDAESPEIERRDTSYPTWEEPKSAFGWLNDPLGLEDGWCFRTRLLPATLATSLPAAADIAGASRPIRAACFGRVYDKRDAQIPFRTVIEGIAASNGMVTEQWRACWEHIARVLFGLDACAWF